MNKKSFSTKRAPDCREGRDKAGTAESKTLDYNRTGGWRGGPPPRQKKNWIPKVALAQGIAVALLLVGGYANGGFLRLPSLPLTSSGGAGLVYNGSLAIAWAMNDVIVGGFPGSGTFHSASTASASGNPPGAAPRGGSSGSSSRSWSSGWLTLNGGTTSGRSGTTQTFRTLLDLLSGHSKNAASVAIGSIVGGSGIRSGSAIGHGTGTSAGFATAGRGTNAANGANSAAGGGGGNRSTNNLTELSSNNNNARSGASNNTTALASSYNSALSGTTSLAPEGAGTGASMAAVTSATSVSAPLDAQRVWNNPTAGSGNWSTTADWVGGTPAGAGDVAAFTSAFGSPGTVQQVVDSNLTISGICFKGTSTSGWSITNNGAGHSLTLTATGTSIGAETGDADSVAIGAGQRRRADFGDSRSRAQHMDRRRAGRRRARLLATTKTEEVIPPSPSLRRTSG